VARGFEFLGYRFDGDSGLDGVDIAGTRWHNSSARLEGLAAEGEAAGRMVAYQKNWWMWVESGVELFED